MDWEMLSNIATAGAGAVAVASAVSLTAIWLLRRRADAVRKLVVRVDRPRNEVFHLSIEYHPESLNQAHFVEVGSLGSNPIYLLPKLHYGLPEDVYDDHIARLTWPKTTGQWTGERLRQVNGTGPLKAAIRIVPATTDASGWLHIRVYTKGPKNVTLLRRRIPVSLLD
jgi:hypothetical protein